MNFLSGQDDFFQTGNQPISVRHLSQPYNKYIYYIVDSKILKIHSEIFSISSLVKISIT